MLNKHINDLKNQQQQITALSEEELESVRGGYYFFDSSVRLFFRGYSLVILFFIFLILLGDGEIPIDVMKPEILGQGCFIP